MTNKLRVPLKDYPGYTITEDGDVYNSDGLKRTVYLAGVPAYKYVSLPDANYSRGWQIKRLHILVAKTFLPNPDNLPVINHIDEDKMNCHKDNLEWCTRSHNVLHSRGTRVEKYRPRKIYSEAQKEEAVIEYIRFRRSKRKMWMSLGISSGQFNVWIKKYAGIIQLN